MPHHAIALGQRIVPEAFGVDPAQADVGQVLRLVGRDRHLHAQPAHLESRLRFEREAGPSRAGVANQRARVHIQLRSAQSPGELRLHRGRVVHAQPGGRERRVVSHNPHLSREHTGSLGRHAGQQSRGREAILAAVAEHSVARDLQRLEGREDCILFAEPRRGLPRVVGLLRDRDLLGRLRLAVTEQLQLRRVHPLGLTGRANMQESQRLVELGCDGDCLAGLRRPQREPRFLH